MKRIISCVLMFIIVSLLVAAILTLATEINEDQYNEVYELAEKFPEIQNEVDTALENSHISFHEYRTIRVEANNVVLQIEREANTIYAQIQPESYEKIRGWIKEFPTLKPKIVALISDDGQIDTNEYSKIWTMMINLQRDKLIQELGESYEESGHYN